VSFAGRLSGMDPATLDHYSSAEAQIRVVPLRRGGRGGYYATAGGSDLIANPQCGLAAGVTLVVKGERGFDRLPRMTAALTAARDRSSPSWERPPAA